MIEFLILASLFSAWIFLESEIAKNTILVLFWTVGLLVASVPLSGNMRTMIKNITKKNLEGTTTTNDKSLHLGNLSLIASVCLLFSMEYYVTAAIGAAAFIVVEYCRIRIVTLIKDVKDGTGQRENQ